MTDDKPATPSITKPQNEPSAEKIIQSQRINSFFEFLTPNYSDDELIKKSKQLTTEITKRLQENGKLVGDIFKDYDVLYGPLRGGEAKVFKVYEKKVPLNKRTFKALRMVEFFLCDRTNVLRELDLLSKINHENVVALEKVFFEYDESMYKITVNMVMPWMKTMNTWLMKLNNNTLEDNSEDNSSNSRFDISKCKRSLSEIRNMFHSIISGVEAIHSHDAVHLDLKFDNIFVIETLNDDFKDPMVKFKAVIGDFGLGLNLKCQSTRAGGTPGWKSFLFPFFFILDTNFRL